MDEERKIKDMQHGESGYTQQWAMWIKPDGTCVVYGNLPVCDTAKGTFDMRIECTSNGYRLHPSRPIEENEPGAMVSFHLNEFPHTGAVESDYLPATLVVMPNNR